MSIYTQPHQPANGLNGIGDMNDGQGTIDPAALNSGGVLPSNNSPRGLKRSRSPDADYGEYAGGDDDDDSKPRKRGRPPKTSRTSGDYVVHGDSLTSGGGQTSQSSAAVTSAASGGAAMPSSGSVASTAAGGASASAVQTTPARPTPAKTTTLKALPTVRDHTTDQLTPEADEYVPRDSDEAGDKKVDRLGYLQGGREYKIRTFTLPGRGQKLFMLATECARCLQYRDSYLLFNKNRSLYKIIASVKEKEELVSHDILPYSYRSRQIAIVTARSMFRQFGSRVIKDGRRVRDDYWEAKAIKQGFTEQDPAGEKRPGAARAREAAAAASLHGRPLTSYGDVVYSNGPGFGSLQQHQQQQQPHLQQQHQHQQQQHHYPPVSAIGAGIPPPLPGFDLVYDPKYRDVPRPRHDLTGAPYVDTIRPSSEAEMAGQASHAAEYSRNINQQGAFRRQIVKDYWHRPHQPPVSSPPAAQDSNEAITAKDQQQQQPHSFGSPRFADSDAVVRVDAAGVLPAPTATATTTTSASVNAPSFSHSHSQGLLQSPVRQASMTAFGRDGSSQFATQLPSYQRSSLNLPISQTASQQQQQQPQQQQQTQQTQQQSQQQQSQQQQQQQQQGIPFTPGGYSPHTMTPQPQQQSWGAPPSQPHQSPSLHRVSTPQFSPGLGSGQIPSPLHAGGHPGQPSHQQPMQPPQMAMLHHQGAAGSLAGQQLLMPGAGLQAMNAAGYAGVNMGQRPAMYGLSGGQQQFMPQPGQQHSQAWATQQGQPQAGSQWGTNFP